MIIPSFTFQLLHIWACVSSVFPCFSLFPAHHWSVFSVFCICEILFFPTLLSTRLSLRLLFCYLPGFFYCPGLLSKRSSISPPTFCPALGSFPQSPTAWFNDGLKLDKWAYNGKHIGKRQKGLFGFFFYRIKAATESDGSKRSRFSLLDWDWVRLAVTFGHSRARRAKLVVEPGIPPRTNKPHNGTLLGSKWEHSFSLPLFYLSQRVPPPRCRGAAQVVDHRSWRLKEKGIKIQVKGEGEEWEDRWGAPARLSGGSVTTVGIAADGSGRGNSLQHFRKGKYRSHFQELPRPYLKSHRPQIVKTFEQITALF